MSVSVLALRGLVFWSVAVLEDLGFNVGAFILVIVVIIILLLIIIVIIIILKIASWGLLAIIILVLSTPMRRCLANQLQVRTRPKTLF